VPKYVIEREIKEVGQLSKAELQSISQHSCHVIDQLGRSVQWVMSYVTDNKLYCIYIAPDAEAIREHAQRGGFPANRISEVRNTIDPTTAESRANVPAAFESALEDALTETRN
jgi:hypothetical protein